MEGRDTSTTVHDMEQIQRKDWYRSYAVTGNFTFATNDKVKTLLNTTGASNSTVTLPDGTDNFDRVIQIWKVDSGAGNVVVTPEAGDTIQGLATVTLYSEYEGIEIKSIGTDWLITNFYNRTASDVRAFMDTSVQNVLANSYIKVRIDAVDFDILGEFDAAVNYRFTAKYAGQYDCKGGAQFRNINDGTHCQTMLYVNGIIESYSVFYAGVGSAFPVVPVVGNFNLAANDYVELFVWHNHGPNRDIGWRDYNTWLTISRNYKGGV